MFNDVNPILSSVVVDSPSVQWNNVTALSPASLSGPGTIQLNQATIRTGVSLDALGVLDVQSDSFLPGSAATFGTLEVRENVVVTFDAAGVLRFNRSILHSPCSFILAREVFGSAQVWLVANRFEMDYLAPSAISMSRYVVVGVCSLVLC